ncbi:MAG: hypothetical protein LKE88_07125 [Acidaminococcus provencensis]|jgi:hypothetical protein|uniref:hypothetical protein n=1 Tax=Acidaminococcus TaxID=904 RepID=UPI000CF9CB8A|nr:MULTISPECIES: hypothetical protein [Acidaminococcus]MCH4096396.1 hypothetical protein [Acidaminococcus provencensis]RHK02925.1 hypothetical protein DW089_02845 [Acidaminococcus sp. AM05-11]
MKALKQVLVLLASLLSLVMLLPGSPAWAAQAPAESPAAVPTVAGDPLNRKGMAFVVYDQTGEVTPAMKALWKRQVRQAYPRAEYTFIDDPQAVQAASAVLSQSNSDDDHYTAAEFAAIGQKAQADVVAVVIVKAMEEYYVEPMLMGWWDDGPDTWLRVLTAADLYLYKQENQKFLHKNLRKVETTEVSLAVPPEREIQYALSNLAMKMENKPEI